MAEGDKTRNFNDAIEAPEENDNIQVLDTAHIKIQKHLNTLNIFCDSKDAHRLLKPDNEPNLISVLPGVSVYCKVETNGNKGPYNLAFKYLNENDVFIYLSQKDKFPDYQKN